MIFLPKKLEYRNHHLIKFLDLHNDQLYYLYDNPKQYYLQVNHVKAIGAVNDDNILSLSYVNNDCV